MITVDVTNIACELFNNVYKNILHTNYGVDCEILDERNLYNFLFAKTTELAGTCNIPNLVECQVNEYTYKAIIPCPNRTYTINCGITISDTTPANGSCPSADITIAEL